MFVWWGMADHSPPPLRTSYSVAALGLIALSLGACDKPSPRPPAPTVNAAPLRSGAAAGNAADTSVPAAEAVLTPGAAAKPDPVAGRTNSSMTRAQEAGAMPLPGQNNDHSAPVAPPKRSSAP